MIDLEEKKQVPVTIQLREDLYEDFRTVVKGKGLTITFVMNRLLQEFIDNKRISEFAMENNN